MSANRPLRNSLKRTDVAYADETNFGKGPLPIPSTTNFKVMKTLP